MKNKGKKGTHYCQKVRCICSILAVYFPQNRSTRPRFPDDTPGQMEGAILTGCIDWNGVHPSVYS